MTEKPTFVDVDLEKLAATKQIAEDIITISEAAHRMLSSGLSKRALLLLIKDETKVPFDHIERVLDVLPKLRSIYLEKPDGGKAHQGRNRLQPRHDP